MTFFQILLDIFQRIILMVHLENLGIVGRHVRNFLSCLFFESGIFLCELVWRAVLHFCILTPYDGLFSIQQHIKGVIAPRLPHPKMIDRIPEREFFSRRFSINLPRRRER